VTSPVMLRFTEGIDLWVTRTDEMFVEEYRDLVRRIFRRILVNTPQYSGKAVANWSIGVGAPDETQYVAHGDAPEVTFSGRDGRVTLHPRHQVGSPEWIAVAEARNEPKLALITRRSRVYFSNGALGDDDEGLSSDLYLDSLQDETYWREKLRTVNQPYEVAAESILFELVEIGRLPGRGFRAGGETLYAANPG